MGLSDSVAFWSCARPPRTLGTRMIWVGAVGLMSRKAYTRSFSYTGVEGMALAMILSAGWDGDGERGWGGGRGDEAHT
jgi:hypothetical protein